jgi:hypothetical protein
VKSKKKPSITLGFLSGFSLYYFNPSDMAFEPALDDPPPPLDPSIFKSASLVAGFSGAVTAPGPPQPAKPAIKTIPKSFFIPISSSNPSFLAIRLNHLSLLKD